MWWDGGSGCCPLISSYAPQSGLALAPGEPRTAATAILRIEVLAAEPFAKPLSVRGAGETENAVRDMVPPHRDPARTERKPTAEFVDDMVVLAHDLIAESRATCSGPFTADLVRACWRK